MRNARIVSKWLSYDLETTKVAGVVNRMAKISKCTWIKF